MSDVAERVKKIVVEHLGVEAEKVVDNANFIEDLGADTIIVRSIKPSAEKTADIRGPVPYGLRREEFDTLQETLPKDVLKSILPIRERGWRSRSTPRAVVRPAMVARATANKPIPA